MSPTSTPPHELSALARKWLSTLARKPAVPVREVESLIQSAGYPCFGTWLAFHDRYAGYCEPIGQDWAIWGLVHQNPTWLEPMQPNIDREPNEDTWYIMCADAHPSLGYRLNNRGEVVGTPAESFDIAVERNALGWDFRQRGETRALVASELRSDDFRQLFETQIRSFFVAEASDRYFRYYMSPRYLLVENARTGAFLRGRTHRDVSPR